MPFRCNARNFFLTYPQCDLSKEDLLGFLVDLADASYGIVCHEKHEDGSPHLHAFIGFSKKFDCRNENFFDCAGFHPNIQAARFTDKVIDYVKKDGDFACFGELPSAIVNGIKKKWGDLINDNVSPRSFRRSVCEHFPREYVLHYNAIESMSERHFKKRCTTYTGRSLNDFNIENYNMLQWYNEEFLGEHERRKSLILCSPSRYGKTEWARSLDTNHMYFNHLVNFKEDWNEEAKYIIFDDIEWEFLPNKKGFFGGQKQFVITDKYSPKRTINWGKICIYLCNEMPKFKSESEREWFEANCIFVELTNKLY